MAIQNYAEKASGGLSFFTTSGGLIGLGPVTITTDDILVTVHGNCPLLVLRSCGMNFEFRGLAYVHGLMDQALWIHWEAEIPTEEFVIQ